MFKLLWFLRGYVWLEICGASPEWALNNLSASRIPFWNVCWIDGLTVQICVPVRQADQALQEIMRSMCDCQINKQVGLHLYLRRLLSRPVFMIGVLFSIILVLLLQQFVFFYQVEGNETVPTDQILREMENLGVRFGTFGPSIHPQWIKDHLLAVIPELQWVTVTQNGCHGSILVRERPEQPITQTRKGYANVVATRSGILTKQAVFAGQPQFQIGDTVKEGDILVSGIVDLERIYTLEYANAEVFARTWRDSIVVVPSTYTEKTEFAKEQHSIWLVVGRRRIKIFGNSGISAVSCDKMKETRKLCLPGDLYLPLSLEIETIRQYEEADQTLQKDMAKQMLSAYAQHRAQSQMQAGQILQSSYTLKEHGNRYEMRAVMECHEMIAQVVPGRWEEEDFDNDGTKRQRRENGTDY